MCLFKFLDKLIFGAGDPVKDCILYLDLGCSHVDGLFCSYPDCEMLKDYLRKIKTY